MKITIKFPDALGIGQALEMTADRLAAYTPEPSGTRFTLDFGHAGRGWFKVEDDA